MKPAVTQKSQDIKHVDAILKRHVFDEIFPPNLTLIPQLNEVYELELAFYESQILSDEEIIRNGAYFAKVGDIETRHFLMCEGEPVKLAEHSSSRLRSFFKNNQFKTGYATHGLFPYRGKFHPQMIKGLINVMGLKPGDTVLDPMMGSGTVLIEARLMGINSIGIDASPFCQFMTQAKLDALQVPLQPIKKALDEAQNVFENFSGLAEKLLDLGERGKYQNIDLFSNTSKASTKSNTLPKDFDIPEVYNFLLLAFLDAIGYSQRSTRKNALEHFRAILERYVFVAEKIQKVLDGVENELAMAKPLEGDARKLPLENQSVDGIIFSPPYSFAIDYLENDAFHLKFLGVEIPKLKESMIGLRGRNMTKQFELYKEDMKEVLDECARILKRGKICSIVVGTNNNQLSRILKVLPHEVKEIPDLFIEMGANLGFDLIKKIHRQITGMANTMRTEYIVMLQRQ